MQVRENSQMQFSFIAHIFLLEGIRISVWQTQDLNIGGSGYRTSILLASAHKLNFVDTMEYYPISQGKLTSTLESVEKTRHSISKPTRLFLTNLAAPAHL